MKIGKSPPTYAVFGLFGAGGFARETMPIARTTIATNDMFRKRSVRLVFVAQQASSIHEVNGHQVISEEEFFSIDDSALYFNVAIADGLSRKRISEKCTSMGAVPLSLISHNALILDQCEIGVGAILSPFSIITSNARIGEYFHCNIYSYVAHDCRIGSFVTFAPSVKCNGNVFVDDFAYIGTGAMLRQGTPDRPLSIGENATVGMGAVVTKDVAPESTVVGNPARILADTKTESDQ